MLFGRFSGDRSGPAGNAESIPWRVNPCGVRRVPAKDVHIAGRTSRVGKEDIVRLGLALSGEYIPLAHYRTIAYNTRSNIKIL